MTRHVLAIDQGTTNSKALLVDERGHIVGRGSRPLAISFPRPGWVEQEPWGIWESVLGAMEDCLAQGLKPDVIGITNQRESLLAWDRKSGKPLGPCVTWQCVRGAAFCDRLRADGAAALVEERSGLALSPLFSAAKARWLLDNIADGQARAEAGDICLGTVDSWLIWRLTDGKVHATDASNASRTQLFGIAAADWDAELLALFAIPRAALPEIRASDAVYGMTQDGIAVAGAAGDSHAAMFGHADFTPGAMKATYGTGSSLMTLAGGKAAAHGLSRTIAWRLGGQVTAALEGNIASTGATLDWLGKLLGTTADGIGAMASDTPDSAGVYLVPAFGGLGAPYWDDVARGLICGMTRGTEARHLARAALEAIAFQVRDVFDAMAAASGAPPALLMADGGACRNDALMQFQADLLDRPILRDRSTDLSALGAAYLAGLATGIWRGTAEIERLPRETDRFEPVMAASRRAELYEGWQCAVHRARLQQGSGHGA